MSYLGNPPAEAFTNTVKDSFDGDGSTTGFTMSQPSVTNDVRVVVENVVQDPTVAYTCAGTTLTFTSAPPSGTDNIYVVHLGPAIQTAQPPAEISSATSFLNTVAFNNNTSYIDNAKAIFGAGSDLQIFSDGTSGQVTGSLTISGGVAVGSALDIREVYEKVTTQVSTTGTITFDTTAQAVELYTADQTANRTINFSNVNANLAIGQSVTSAILLTNGATPYYLNAYQVDGSSVTPKWQGGTAPTAGNASSIDSYSFTIIKTADATFTVLASQTQFA
jgi:hypothetical protein